MILSDLETRLKTLCAQTYRRSPPPGKTKYIVCAEYGLKAVKGDNSDALRWPKVQIDAYIQTEDGNVFFESILDELDALGLPHTEPDIGYEDESSLIRMTVQCEVI